MNLLRINFVTPFFAEFRFNLAELEPLEKALEYRSVYFCELHESSYCISSYSFRRNYSLLNLKIVANSNDCRNISIFYLETELLLRKLFKFRYYEKATKFEKNQPPVLTTVVFTE